jgi:hypothetical protein
MISQTLVSETHVQIHISEELYEVFLEPSIVLDASRYGIPLNIIRSRGIALIRKMKEGRYGIIDPDYKFHFMIEKIKNKITLLQVNPIDYRLENLQLVKY